MSRSGDHTPQQQRIAALSPDKHRLLQRWVARDHAGTVLAKRETAVTAESTRQHAEPSTHLQKVRTFYDDVSANLDASALGQYALFLNYGYADNASNDAASVAPRSLNGNCVRLVLEVIGACELADRDILDIGCGRGGTIDVISGRAKPRRIVGVDLSPRAIGFCRALRVPNACVLAADAARLPFSDAAFDTVVNIESSHCYDDLGAFYREVRRVLRVGGMFLYADLLPTSEMNEWLEQLCSSGFVREHARDITQNVLRSCRETAALHASAFADGASPRELPEFVGAPGSSTYREMETGATSYRIWRLRKCASV